MNEAPPAGGQIHKVNYDELGLWSGQTLQTVNLPALAFVGSNPTPSTKAE